MLDNTASQINGLDAGEQVANLLWAALFGFVMFADLPDAWTLLGAAIIAASGLYILHREKLRRAETGGD